MSGHPGHIEADAGGEPLPRLIAWELTRTCLLNCQHCRAAARHGACRDELSTEECFRLLDNIASFAKPIIILTGGEPMLREDVYDIASYAAHRLKLPVVMAPCGVLLNDETAGRIVSSGIHRISLSLDGADERTHDAFRGFPGSFQAVMDGIAAARRAGLDFQINTTVSRHNQHQLAEILDLSIRLGASVFNPFLLVPIGRGKDLVEQELSAGQYEQALQWLAGQQGRKDIQIRVTCAPHYQRILRQCGGSATEHASKGCLGGKAFAFVSHVGKVQICGFLDVECGDVRKENYDFARIWRTSEVFARVRDVDRYHGRCGYCEFRKVCGGCRARAYATGGDYMGEEPFCVHQPRRAHAADAKAEAAPELSAHDRKILTVIQAGFPADRRPYDVLASRLGIEAGEILRRVGGLIEQGYIRRLGAVFDARKLGYRSTLVAAGIPVDRLDEVAQVVSQLPGVTHNYRRDHPRYNLWFTLTAESDQKIEDILEDLRRRTGLAEFHSLPALAVYKSSVLFYLEELAETSSKFEDRSSKGQSQYQNEGAVKPRTTNSAMLSLANSRVHAFTNSRFMDRQIELIRRLQGSLPLTEEPFCELAERTGMDVDALLGQVRQWLADGVIKRLGAVVAHRKLGFTANGMAVFRVGSERADEVGALLSERPEISHCYRRPELPGWPYNLFAMVHGESQEQVCDCVRRAAGELNLEQPQVLFSTKEYKKTSMEFFPHGR